MAFRLQGAQLLAASVGFVLLFAALICNEIFISKFLSSDGNLFLQTRIILGIFDVLLVLTGILFVRLRKKAMIQNISVTVIVIFFLFISAEAVYRIILGSSNIIRDNPHKTGSYRLKPNKVIYTKVNGKKIEVRTNSFGMRWREVSLNNSDRKKRIAFVGDSFVFGCWTDYLNQSFVGVFDSFVSSKDFEVLNFGVPGYGLEDVALQLKEDILPFHPEYLMVVFFNGNDMRDTYLGLSRYQVDDGYVKILTEQVNKKVPKDFRGVDFNNWAAFLKGGLAFRLFDLAQSSLSGFLSQWKNDPSLLWEPKPLFNNYMFWSQKEYPPIGKEALTHSLEVLKDIQKICRSNNTQLVLIALPFREQVEKEKFDEDYSLELPQKHLAGFAHENGIPYLDLLLELRAIYMKERTSLYLPNDVHLNNEGHRWVGETIARFFVGL